MKIKLLNFVFLGSLVLVLVSEARSSRDYMFSITGVVTTEDGVPLENAEITLEVGGSVYEGPRVVKTVKRLTDSTGGFVFMYTSHRRGVQYSITTNKAGFEPQTISGSAPPAGHHTIRLKQVVRKDTGKE